MCVSHFRAPCFELGEWRNLLRDALSHVRRRLDIGEVANQTLRVVTLGSHIVLVDLLFGGVAQTLFSNVRARFSPIPTRKWTTATVCHRNAIRLLCWRNPHGLSTSSGSDWKESAVRFARSAWTPSQGSEAGLPSRRLRPWRHRGAMRLSPSLRRARVSRQRFRHWVLALRTCSTLVAPRATRRSMTASVAQMVGPAFSLRRRSRVTPGITLGHCPGRRVFVRERSLLGNEGSGIRSVALNATMGFRK